MIQALGHRDERGLIERCITVCGVTFDLGGLRPLHPSAARLQGHRNRMGHAHRHPPGKTGPFSSSSLRTCTCGHGERLVGVDGGIVEAHWGLPTGGGSSGSAGLACLAIRTLKSTGAGFSVAEPIGEQRDLPLKGRCDRVVSWPIPMPRR